MTKRGTFVKYSMIAAAMLVAGPLLATEYHVSVKGSDRNPGTVSRPFRTISRAAQAAEPGDTITVHAGTYREEIKPTRGGTSDDKRILYRAAPGEDVSIKGSEVVKGWKKVQDDTWKVVIPNALFGKFNPFADLLHGDWFSGKGRQHHTGAVYLDGDWLMESDSLQKILKPAGDDPRWFAQVDGKNTTIWAQFKGIDPNQHVTEINVRQTVFYPEKEGINYLTIRGFKMADAATPWAPPTAEQKGLIGTHWSKGWIIENNEISYSKCTGVALGKYGDDWDNKAESAEGYVGTINRAIAHGWSKENIGHHIVRNNIISHCEQSGVVGSLGAAFSTVTGNLIHDINWKQLFGGAEMAGIKIHGAVDVVISHNHIYHSAMGIWLDWMAQGTRVSGNLLHDNGWTDIFEEVDHGPILVDNNICLTKNSVIEYSEGCAYVHNLFAGKIQGGTGELRKTPYFKPHTVDLVDIVNIRGGDMRIYNNLVDESAISKDYYGTKLPLSFGGNALLPKPANDPVTLAEKDGAFYLQLNWEKRYDPKGVGLITTAMLGKAVTPGEYFENPDGSPLSIDRDYFGNARDTTKPTVGPIQNPGEGTLSIKVWPLEQK